MNVTIPPPAPLTLLDRCDRCGAEALARVEKDGLDLDFCGHHFDDAAMLLSVQGWTLLQDKRVPS